MSLRYIKREAPCRLSGVEAAPRLTRAQFSDVVPFLTKHTGQNFLRRVVSVTGGYIAVMRCVINLFYECYSTI